MQYLVLISILVLFSFRGWRLSTEALSICFTTKIIVSQSGRGNFTTITDAIKQGVPRYNLQWIHILVHRGIYNEQVEIPKEKPYIILEGEGSDSTIVSSDHHGNIKDATFIVSAYNVVVKNLTFKNTYNHVFKRIDSIDNPRVPAVATFVEGDMVSFYNCSFLGAQDTLLDSDGRHFFHNCCIEGFVDFIMGSGQSVYENCLINVIAESLGYITAQHRNSEHDPSGFVFKSCNVSGTGNNVYLGRAWGPYARVVFYDTIFSDIVSPEGWDAWDFVGHEANFTYAEVNCFGPGSNTSKRVNWEKKLKPDQIEFFMGSSFNNADGWIEKQLVYTD